MNKFSHYFKDSYGWDKLSKYLLIIGVVFLFSKSTILLGLLLIVYSIFRSLSKNKYKRYQELNTFQNYLVILNKQIYGLNTKINNFKAYKIFKCPNCSQKLRVPRRKGKITITCRKCSTEFKGKS